MSRISLVVSDVDGTLVTRDKRLTPATVSAVDMLRRRGILFSITSSRPGFGMRQVVEALGIDLPIGPFNGSSLINPDLSVIEESVVPADATRDALAVLAGHGIDIWVFTNSEWLIQSGDVRYVPLETRTIATAPRIVPEFGEAVGRAGKIVGVSDDFALLARCEAELQAMLGDRAHAVRSQNYYLDITPPRRNKGTFITALSARLGIAPGEVATIGDMANDVPMFARSGHSIAMGNATDAVKAKATSVTDTNEADGFAKAMQKLLATTT